MALKCTNTSGPDSCEMKPNPFSALNHLTTPTGTNVPPGEAAPRACDPAPAGGGRKGNCSKRLDLLNPSRAPYQARVSPQGTRPLTVRGPSLLVSRAVHARGSSDGPQQRSQPRLEAGAGRRFAPSPPGKAQGLHLLPGLDSLGRLQGRQPPRAVPLGAGQDQGPPHDRQLQPPPAGSGRGHQDGPGAGAPALRQAHRGRAARRARRSGWPAVGGPAGRAALAGLARSRWRRLAGVEEAAAEAADAAIEDLDDLEAGDAATFDVGGDDEDEA